MLAKRLVAGCIRFLFHAFDVLPQQKTIAFLSRQSYRPFDFSLLEPRLLEQFPEYKIKWACVAKPGKLGLGLFLKQLFLVAISTICFVDGYVPAVSVPPKHRSVCIQLWHASGAIKKFGYQCLNTPAGRTSQEADVFRMHKGYDYIIAGLPGSKEAFTEAFAVDSGSIQVFGLPSMDYLLDPDLQAQREYDMREVRGQLGLTEDESQKIVLYAPTLRRGKTSRWLQENIRALSAAFARKDVLLLVAAHPLDDVSVEGLHCGAPVEVLKGHTIKALGVADVVISDYSSVVFDAGILGKKVLFYVPDIAEYRLSPGLNIDPMKCFPSSTYADAGKLAHAALAVSEDAGEDFRAFMSEYAGMRQVPAIDSICKLVSGIIGGQDR